MHALSRSVLTAAHRSAPYAIALASVASHHTLSRCHASHRTVLDLFPPRIASNLTQARARASHRRARLCGQSSSAPTMLPPYPSPQVDPNPFNLHSKPQTRSLTEILNPRPQSLIPDSQNPSPKSQIPNPKFQSSPHPQTLNHSTADIRGALLAYALTHGAALRSFPCVFVGGGVQSQVSSAYVPGVCGTVCAKSSTDLANGVLLPWRVRY